MVLVCSVVGARPQFVKAAALSRVLRQCHDEVLIHTGQHYDANMSDIFFRELGITPPDVTLGIGSGTHAGQTGRMLVALEDEFVRLEPDVVLVYGDTNSTLAASLAAAKLDIPVAHVEAGLRSFRRDMPEEINRVLTDHVSTFLFCPSEGSAANLATEGIREGVHIVGDVMAEALIHALRAAERSSNVLPRLSLQPGSYLLVTVHRAQNTDDPRRLLAILDALSSLDEVVIFPVHPRTRAAIEQLSWRAGPNVRLFEPFGYLDMVMLASRSRLILTDSGGLQKEAYWLQVPCLTLRDETEWKETVDVGWNVLTGAQTDRIVERVRGFRPAVSHPVLYGDGTAASRCTNILSAAC